MRLQFLGSGDAFGSGGRFNTCMRVERPQGDFLIDCGASSMIAMRRFGVDPNAIQTIFISHLHGDHFGGLPFFILDAQFYSRRETPLTLVGPPGFRTRLLEAMEVFFPGSSASARKFDVDIREIEPGDDLMVNDVTLRTAEVKHACGAPPLGLRLTSNGKTIVYSGDTEWTEALVDLTRDADVFVVEALFFEKKVRHHLDYATFRANVDRCKAKRIVLTHCGPDMLARLSEADHEAAEAGIVIEL